jgi:hypothetical protein
MRPDELEQQLRERLDTLGPAPRAELLHESELLRWSARLSGCHSRASIALKRMKPFMPSHVIPPKNA